MWQEGVFSFPTNQAIFFFSSFHTFTGVIRVDEYPSVEELSITHHSSFFMSQPPVIASGDTTHVGLARKPENYPYRTWRTFVGGLQCFESLEQSSEVVPYVDWYFGGRFLLMFSLVLSQRIATMVYSSMGPLLVPRPTCTYLLKGVNTPLSMFLPPESLQRAQSVIRNMFLSTVAALNS